MRVLGGSWSECSGGMDGHDPEVRREQGLEERHFC